MKKQGLPNMGPIIIQDCLSLPDAISFVLVCHDKVPQKILITTEIYCLTILEARNLKATWWQGNSLSVVSRRRILSCFAVFGNNPWCSSLCRCITSTSASIIT